LFSKLQNPCQTNNNTTVQDERGHNQVRKNNKKI
jgi:hypothetical protein